MTRAALALLVALGSVGCDDSLEAAPPDLGADSAAPADAGKPDSPQQGDGPESPDSAAADQFVNECAGKPDGAPCGAGATTICLKQACVTSSCGDGYVDEKGGEDCEDGNIVEGDGCSRCHFDCKQNSDCDDGANCNGSEACDVANHVCLPGAQVADGTVCQQLGGAQGVCVSGSCLPPGCGNGAPDGNEQCDDGNKVGGDGCEADCTWTCQKDQDCDDGDLCNGKESCDTSVAQKPVCKAGTPVTCNSTVTCKSSCDPLSGKCVYDDQDKDNVGCNKDCDDKDASVFPGAPECKDGKDNDCDTSTPDGADGDCKCYVDADNDGFAASIVGAITALPCPKNTTQTRPQDASNTDCFDARADVSPKQGSWFTTPYCRKRDKNGKCLLESFDYNCSGAAEPRYKALSKGCKSIGPGKCSGNGWSATKIPACGVTAVYIACKSSGVICVPLPAPRVQNCR